MDKDNDSLMLEQSDGALTVLMVKFRMASLDDRAAMRPSLMKLIDNSAEFRLRLFKEGVITTEDDLNEIGKIRDEIDAAGSKQALLLAIARTVAFIAMKI